MRIMISAFIWLFAIKIIRYIAIVIVVIHNYIWNMFLLLEKIML
jgi:hypothetical protein